MITELKWTVVYTRDNKPLAAFVDRALAEGYTSSCPENGEQMIERKLFIGDAEAKAVRLLRDILSPGTEDDFRQQNAIDEGKRMLGIP